MEQTLASPVILDTMTPMWRYCDSCVDMKFDKRLGIAAVLKDACDISSRLVP